MGAVWIKCPACGLEVVSGEQPFVCVEVRDRTCVTIGIQGMNESLAEVIHVVHEGCFTQFEELVATGVYASPSSN
jgi:hypothetical protein